MTTPAMPEPLGWYVVNNIGMATLCKDEAEAQLLAEDCDMVYKRQAPHRAVQLVALSSQPSPEQAGVSDAEIRCLGQRNAWHYKYSSDPAHSSTYKFNDACLLQFARAILALRPQAVPMTDEQIVAALKACDREDPSKEGWIWRTRIKWARAIEAYHGITAPAGGEKQA